MYALLLRNGRDISGLISSWWAITSYELGLVRKMVNKRNRGKLLVINSLTSILGQMATVICGFVLTRLILEFFGSTTNGLVASISQFLGFIAFLEMGIGAVVKSALYKPLAQKNEGEISSIIVACRRFYRKIALVLIIYTCILMIAFPILSHDGYSWIYSASLVFIISLSLFAQYFIGMPYQLLLNADQKAYIPAVVCGSTLVFSTLVSAIAMNLGCSIHIVKLVASISYIARPLIYLVYVKKHYNIDNHIIISEDPLPQRWNGLAQHIAYVVVNYTDIVVLTLLSTFASVSIYSVYHNVTIGVQQLISSVSVGVSAMLGSVLYSENLEKTRRTFAAIEWFFHAISVFLFTVTGILLIPFVKVYTEGITDTNYIVPVFAVLITLAQASYSLRIPYETMILAANHYKQTQKSAIVEALINICISVCLVKSIGLIGVAIGTLVAMTYRTVYLVIYLSKNIINYKISVFPRMLLIDLGESFLCVMCSKFVKSNVALSSWGDWIILAIVVSLLCFIICFIFNILFYRQYVKMLVNRLRRKRVHNEQQF